MGAGGEGLRGEGRLSARLPRRVLPAAAPPAKTRLVIVTAARTAYERLRADILRCALAPGERLRIHDLTKRYASGPIPTREALNRLAAEGLALHSDQRGFTVAPISAEDLVELTLARAWVYEIAMRESVRRGDDAWEERCLLAYHRLKKVPRYLSVEPPAPNPDYDRPHRDFHIALISACGSRWMIDIAERLFDHAERYRNLSRKIAIIPREDEHKKMIDAVLARSGDEAVALLKRHVELTAEIVAGPPARAAKRPKAARGRGGARGT